VQFQGTRRQDAKAGSIDTNIRAHPTDVYPRQGVTCRVQEAHNESVKRELAAKLCAGSCVLFLFTAEMQRPTVITASPGDVVRIDGKATVLGETWTDLIGVDLSTRPGTYPISAETVLKVLPKQFPIRRLRVAPDFVTPPPEALAQIADDNKKLVSIWGRVTPRKWSGAFLLPVDGQPTSNFGTRSYFNGQRRSPHTGVDFLSPTGTPIRAANHGVVVLAEPLYFTGNTLVIDYGGGLYSMYAHLSEFRAHQGDTVAPETIVGLVGATGRVTGPHLHWAVRLQRAQVDPLSLVAASAATPALTTTHQ
jgi:murein DD-endopeptidase MepM/ murein hydrolase activator NlpD